MTAAKKTEEKPKAAKSKDNKGRSNPVTPASLRTWNKVLALVYAAQGIAILLLGTAKSVPLTVSYLAENPLASEASGETVFSTAVRTIADVNIVYLIAAMLFVSALVHASAAWWLRGRYDRDLTAKTARMRWLAAIPVVSLLFIILAALVGITDIAVLLSFVVMVAAAMLLAILTEQQYSAERGGSWRLLCYVRSAVAFAPWAVIAVYLAGSCLYNTGASVPGYVLSAAVSVFVLSVGAALLFHFQHHKTGRWADYLYSERAYMALGLLAQTVLAWVVYAGALA